MPRTARSPASNAQLRGAHGAIYPSATMRQSRYSPRTMASVLASWSPPATLPAPSPLLPSAEKKQKGAPPCSGNRARSFLLMRVNRVAALSAQAQRRWPRPPHRSQFSHNSAYYLQPTLGNENMLSQVRFNQKIYPAPLPRAKGAMNATPLTQLKPRFLPNGPTISK